MFISNCDQGVITEKCEEKGSWVDLNLYKKEAVSVLSIYSITNRYDLICTTIKILSGIYNI